MTFRILNDSGWSVEKKSGSDMIWSKYIPNFGKVLKFEVRLNFMKKWSKKFVFWTPT